MIKPSTGKEFDEAYGNVVGIDQNGIVCGGYDDSSIDHDLSKEDRIALAQIMIERWTKYLEAASEQCKTIVDIEARGNQVVYKYQDGSEKYSVEQFDDNDDSSCAYWYMKGAMNALLIASMGDRLGDVSESKLLETK